MSATRSKPQVATERWWSDENCETLWGQSRETVGTSISSITNAGLWRAGAIYTGLGIALGAYGSHGLKKRAGVGPDQVSAWQTATSYAIFNGIALMMVSLHPRFSTHRFAGPAIAVGTAMFSGSIFLLVSKREQFKFFGPVTPLGGMTLMAGYAALAF